MANQWYYGVQLVNCDTLGNKMVKYETIVWKKGKKIDVWIMMNFSGRTFTQKGKQL